MAEGPNLIVNGDFPSNINNWTNVSDFPGLIEWVSPGEMRVYGKSIPIGPMMSAQAPAAGYQSVSVNSDTDYQFLCDVKTAVPASGTGGVGSDTGGYPFNFTYGSQAMTSTGIKTVDFTTPPSTPTVYAQFQQQGIPFSARFFDVDDVSLREQNIAADFRPIVMFF